LKGLRSEENELNITKERIKNTQNKFKTFYEEKILKENCFNNDNFEDNGEISLQNEFYNPKPEMQKFKIEGFNLNSMTKKNRLSQSQNLEQTENGIYEEKTMKIEEKKENIHKKNLDFSNFKVFFDKCLKTVVSQFQATSENQISEYVFEKMSILEYFHCLRFDYIIFCLFE